MKTIKKLGLVAIAGSLIISLSSCLSTDFTKGYLTKENVETLNTKSFTLNAVIISTEFNLIDKDVALNILKQLPVEKIKNDLMENYGISLDTASFTNEVHGESKIGLLQSDKGVSLGMWGWEDNEEIKKKSPSGIMFVRLGIYNQKNPLSLSISTSLYDSEDNNLTHIYAEENWASGHAIVDKEEAAIVKFGKHISPDYIQTKDGIEPYSTYYQNNAASDGGIYVDTKNPVKISVTVNDPGIFMLLDPSTFCDAIIEETYEKGKSYTINYKVNRDVFLKSDWTVEFSKTED